jgi:hypothetical protein
MTAPKQNAPPQPAVPGYDPLKHGIDPPHQIMFDEAAADLAGLSAEYREQHRPSNSVERFLVDTLVNNEWRLRRMRCVEADLWVQATNAFLEKNTAIEACSSGDSFTTGAGPFDRLQRLVNSCERNYHRALNQLQHLQVARAHGLRPLQPEQSKATSASLASFRQNSQTPPPANPQPAPPAPVSQPDRAANPTGTRPSAADRDPNLPDVA